MTDSTINPERPSRPTPATAGNGTGKRPLQRPAGQGMGGRPARKNDQGSATDTRVAGGQRPARPMRPERPVVPQRQRHPGAPKGTSGQATTPGAPRSAPVPPQAQPAKEQPPKRKVVAKKSRFTPTGRLRKKHKNPRGPEITNFDRAALLYLYKVGIARLEHIHLALEGTPNRTTKPVVDKATGKLVAPTRKKESVRDNVLVRLRKMGLVRSESIGPYQVWSLSKEGLDYLSPDTKRKNRVATLHQARHRFAAAWVAAYWTSAGAVVITDDEMERAQKASGKSQDDVEVHSMDRLTNDPSYGVPDPDTVAEQVEYFYFRSPHAARFGVSTTKTHRPDLVVVPKDGGAVIAVEVELSSKERLEWLRIFSGYATALEEGRFHSVHYYCPPAVMRGIKKALWENRAKFPEGWIVHNEATRKVEVGGVEFIPYDDVVFFADQAPVFARR